MYINRCQNFATLVVGVEQLTGPRGGAGVGSLLQGIILLLAPTCGRTVNTAHQLQNMQWTEIIQEID